MKTNNHKKFYNSIKKYGWSNLGFKIIEFVDDKNNLLNREQFWLDKIFKDKKFKENTLNILQNCNSWLNNKHSNETKKLISNKMKGKIHSDEHKFKISNGLLNKKNQLKLN